MDRKKLIQQLGQRYYSKRDVVTRLPLGIQPETVWQEIQDQRRSQGTPLPLLDCRGRSLWYVTTPKMISISEKIVETLYENEADFDPYANALPVSTLEEIFYTSYVEGSQITMQAAMDFLTSEIPPRDIEEQLITNNRMAGAYAGMNLFRKIDGSLLQELAGILTDGLDRGGPDFRSDDAPDFTSVSGEEMEFPHACDIPSRVDEITAFLSDPMGHPLIKAAVVQAWMVLVRPFPEGNERLSRLLSNMVLLRAGYTFFADISLSALIARKSYGYFKAADDILSPASEGDLTYFLEYFFELLSRALDERRLRLNRKEEQNRQAEMEMAHTTLSPSVPENTERTEHTEHTEDKENTTGKERTERRVQDSEALPSAALPPAALPPAAQENNSHVPSPPQARSGPPALSVRDVTTSVTSGITAGSIPGSIPGSAIDWLIHYSKGPQPVTSQFASYLLRLVDSRKTSFTVAEAAKDLNLKPLQLSRSLHWFRKRRIIILLKQSPHQTRYKIAVKLGISEVQDTEEPKAEPEQSYDPAILEILKKLLDSPNSIKDRRIGTMLSHYLPKGEITLDDYIDWNQESRWHRDMVLAERMHLVERIDHRHYKILKEYKPGIAGLSPTQRKITTQLYESFGNESFSSEMVIATLDYAKPSIHAYLHQFTLLRILDYDKEDVNHYHFLVNPVEHPQFFTEVA